MSAADWLAGWETLCIERPIDPFTDEGEEHAARTRRAHRAYMIEIGMLEGHYLWERLES